MKPPLLLIHGAFSNADHFAAWSRFFARRGFGCVVPNLPGHAAGEAEQLRTLTIADYLCAVRGAVARLSSPPILIGHSMGGLLAQQLATLEPCQALICIASAPPWRLTPQFRALPFVLPMTEAILRAQPVRPSAPAFRSLALHDLPEREQESLVRTLGEESGHALRSMILGLARLPGSRFTGPVLCISGATDRIVSQRISTAIARYYAADQEVFDSGHWLIAESAVDRIAGRALEWIERRL